jgi:hypothetical protein
MRMKKIQLNEENPIYVPYRFSDRD